jgi:predicted NACHT family NTPase
MPPSPRSLKLSAAGKQRVELALTDKLWSTEKLAEAIGVSVPTAKTFRAGKKGVERQNFVKFCQVLGLNWQEVAEADQPLIFEVNGSYANSQTGSEITKQSEQSIRQHCREHILHNYSEIRLLSGEKIKVDQLYVDVWLLNRSPRTFQTSQSKMLETFDLRNDRLGLGERIQRNPGFDVANAESKLVILGKPGAGKTTFLKHLAVDWCDDKFQSELIAVFIELRRIRDNQWKFIDAVKKELGLQEQQQVEALLKAGKLMILMDGLDEVSTGTLRREVQEQLVATAKEYSQSRFIMTCRTQVMTTFPEVFASVEVADFSEHQVETFVKNWFQANGQDERAVAAQWTTFKSAIVKNEALKELCIIPVLLGLMCLVLQDEGEIPAQSSSLYERGIKLLLRKWNDEKDIPEWEMGTATYRDLEIEQKENLLIQIAAKKFENPKNFVLFEEDELIQQIVEELNLPNRKEGEEILKAIEAQHGLLIERADELWSFSHLTFQEYFTTKWLLSLSSEQLAQKITDEQWQNVVQQLVKSQGHSDRLLRLIKQALDQMLSQDPNLQKILIWLCDKAQLVQGGHRQSSTRAFYLHLALIHDLNIARDRDLDIARDRDLARALEQYFVLNLDRTLARDRALARALALARAIAYACNLDRNHSLIEERRSLALVRDLDLALVLALDRNFDLALTNQLQQLRDKMPALSHVRFRQWWQSHGLAWITELRQATIRYRNIGHDWQFTAEQKQQLQSYYDTSKFLVDLLKIENAVTPEVRQEIEDNLLLPIAELKRRLPEQYGT